MKKILIHTTSITEAKAIIDFFNLKELKDPKKNIFYSNDDILLVVSATSKEKILESLDYVFNNFEISKAFDLSIASCSDGSIELGTLFCTNKLIFGLNFANITTVEQELQTDENLDTLLVDKQASFFKDVCKDKIKDYYILKVVSDHFDTESPKEEKIFELINNSILKWKNLI